MIIKEKNVFTNFAIYKILFTILIIRIETIKTIQHIWKKYQCPNAIFEIQNIIQPTFFYKCKNMEIWIFRFF
jgi:hypothetical protein